MSTPIPLSWVAKQTELKQEFTSLIGKTSPEISEGNLKTMEEGELKDACRLISLQCKNRICPYIGKEWPHWKQTQMVIFCLPFQPLMIQLQMPGQ